jgi:hypothetical protein
MLLNKEAGKRSTVSEVMQLPELEERIEKFEKMQ